MRSFFSLRFWMRTAIALVLLIGISNGAWAAEYRYGDEPVGAAEAGASYSGATFYVSPNGNNSFPGTLQKPWKTLKYAVSRLKSGQTLVLRGGSYSNKDDVVTITTPQVQLKNHPGETPVIDGQFLRPGVNGAQFSSRPVRGDSKYPKALWPALIRIATQKVTIDGITLKKSTGQGITLEQAQYSTIKNCTVSYTMHVGVRTGGRKDNNALDAYNLVENSTFTNCNYAQDTGVVDAWNNISTAVATTGKGSVVRNNVVAMNPYAGVEGFMDDGTFIENNTIFGNRVTQVHLAKCNRVTIRNNLVFGLVKRTGHTAEYGGITMTGGTGAGISVRTETWSNEKSWNKGHRVYGNKIANAAPALHFGVEGNPPKDLASGHPGATGWQQQTLDDCKFYNNTIIHPASGKNLSCAIRVRDDKHIGTGNSFFNNIFWGPGRLAMFSKEHGVGQKIAFGYNLWSKAPEVDRFKASTDSTATNYPSLNMSDYFSKTSGWDSLLDPKDALKVREASSKLASYFDLLSSAVHAIDKGTSNISGVKAEDFSQTTFGSFGGNSIDIGAGSGGGAGSSSGSSGAALPSTTIEPPVLSIVPNE